jgi:hypothetical protein
MSSLPASGPRHVMETAGRCASCGARLRAEERWCSLCHASVPEAGVVAEWAPSAEASIILGAADQGVADEGESGESERVVGADVPAVESDAETAAAADQLLAELKRAEVLLARGSGLGKLRDLFGVSSPRATALLLAGVGGVCLLVVMILGLTLIGLVL